MVARECKLRQLFLDHEIGQCILHGKLVAEAYAVIIHTEAHVHGNRFLAILGRRLLQLHQQLIVMVADGGLLAPHRLPRLVKRGRLLVNEDKVACELTAAHELESEL